jgi:signal transduction histidine kinase
VDAVTWSTQLDTRSPLWSLGVLDRLSTTIGQSLILEVVLKAGLETLIDAFGFDVGVIVMPEPGERLRNVCQLGDLPVAVGAWLTQEAGGGRLLHELEPLVWSAEDGPDFGPPGLAAAGRSLVCAPVYVQEERLGLMAFTAAPTRELTALELETLAQASYRLALAVRNAVRFSLINEVSQAAASILSLDIMLNTVAQAIQRRFGYLRISIFLVDAEEGVVRIGSQAGVRGDRGQVGFQLPLGEGLVGQAARESRTKLANDLRHYPGTSHPGPHTDAVRAELAVPIRLGSKVVGVLDLQSGQVDAFRPQDVATIELLADQLSIAIENARLYGEIRQRVEELTTLNKISQAVSSTLDLRETLTIITDHTTRLLGVAATSVVLYDETNEDLWFAAASGEGSESVLGVRLVVGQGIAGWVFQQGEAVLVPDTSRDTRWFGGFDRDTGFRTRSILCVPLQAKGQTIGAIEAINKENGPFDEEDLRLLTSMAAPAATAIENAKLYEALRQGMRQLEQTQAQLIQSAKLAAVGELAAGVAHEINNPLTSIIGFTRLLLDDLPADHLMRADLEIIDREADRTRRIVRTLLDFARTSEPVLVPANLNALIEETIMLVCTRSVLGKISLKKDLLPLPPIMLDVNQIKQVLVNLLNNAVQAMPQGGQLTVSTRLTERKIDDVDRPMAAVYVSDSGEGIPSQYMSRIFDPFFTTKEVGKGTGLGLSVSYSIAEKHNGRIEVESAPGEGSTFVLLLPVGGLAHK